MTHKNPFDASEMMKMFDPANMMSAFAPKKSSAGSECHHGKQQAQF